MNKVLVLLLAVLLAFSFTFTAFACTEYCGDEWWYDDDDDNDPTNEELRNAAFRVITEHNGNISGMTARVVHAGNIRQSYTSSSRLLGTAFRDEEFTILGYQYNSPTSLWLQIQYLYSSAWIAASLVEIDCSGVVQPTSPATWPTQAPVTPPSTGVSCSCHSYCVGMRCRITVSSARARVKAGTAYPIVEYVGRNKEYTILDVTHASDGTLWYQIMDDNKLCWISSGVATIEGYSY